MKHSILRGFVRTSGAVLHRTRPSLPAVAWLVLSAQPLNIPVPLPKRDEPASVVKLDRGGGWRAGGRSGEPVQTGPVGDQEGPGPEGETVRPEETTWGVLSSRNSDQQLAREALYDPGTDLAEAPQLTRISDPFGLIAAVAIALMALTTTVRKLKHFRQANSERSGPHGVPGADPEMERLKTLRREPRHHTTFRYGVLYEEFKKIGDCSIVDRSTHGARIRTSATLREGDHINFLDNSEMIFYSARVAWKTENEAGLELVFLRRMRMLSATADRTQRKRSRS